jgi:hypothetical protein
MARVSAGSPTAVFSSSLIRRSIPFQVVLEALGLVPQEPGSVSAAGALPRAKAMGCPSPRGLRRILGAARWPQPGPPQPPPLIQPGSPVAQYLQRYPRHIVIHLLYDFSTLVLTET